MIIKSINRTYGYKGLPDGFHVDFDDEVTYVVGDNFKTKSTILGVPLWVITGYNMAGSNQENVADDKRSNIDKVIAEISFVDNDGELHTLMRKKGKSTSIILDGVNVTKEIMAKFYKDIQFFLCCYNPYRFNSLSNKDQQEILLRLLPSISSEDAFNMISEDEQQIIERPIPDNKGYSKSRRADIKDLKYEIERYEGQIDAMIPTIMMSEEEKKEFTKQDRLDFLEAEYEKLLNGSANVTNIEEIQRRIKRFEEMIKQILEVDLAEAKNKKKELENKLSNKHVCYYCKQEIKNEVMIRNIEQLDRKELEKLKNTIDKKKAEAKDYLKTMNSLKETYNSLNNEETLKKLSDKQGIKNEIDTLRQEKNEILNFNQTVEMKKQTINNAKKQVEQLKEKIEQCKNKIELYEKQIKISDKMRVKIIEEQLKGTENLLKNVSIQFFTFDESSQELKEDYKLLYKGREYSKLSQSEKMRADFEISNFINKKSGINAPTFIDDTERIREIKIADDIQVVMALYIKYSELEVLYEYNDVLRKKKESIEQQLMQDQEFVYLNAA